MKNSSDSRLLLDKAVKAYAARDFYSAQELFKWLCELYPENWTARYFNAMNLCAMGDFTDARAELEYIQNTSKDAVWQHVSRCGIAVVNNKEAHLRRSLTELLH